jgi:hypothetical protein
VRVSSADRVNGFREECKKMGALNTVENFSTEINPNRVFGDEKEAACKGLFRSCIYGICLRLKQHVLATHQELSILRGCADMMRDQSPRVIHVVASANKQKTKFIVNTLMHLGVSCGQIKVSASESTPGEDQDVWIFVTDS